MQLINFNPKKFCSDCSYELTVLSREFLIDDFESIKTKRALEFDTVTALYKFAPICGDILTFRRSGDSIQLHSIKCGHSQKKRETKKPENVPPPQHKLGLYYYSGAAIGDLSKHIQSGVFNMPANNKAWEEVVPMEHPGRYLNILMKRKSELFITDLARLTGLAETDLNAILNEQKNIDEAIAHQLDKAFPGDGALLLYLQDEFDYYENHKRWMPPDTARSSFQGRKKLFESRP